MDLVYTDEQELFRKSVREFASDRVPPERLAEIADGEGWEPGLWKEASTLGLAGISVPEDRGGAGLGFVEEAIAAEELGRAVFPGPWLGTVVLAQPALAQVPELLEAVAAGERVATLVGLEEPVTASEGRLRGTARYVADLGAADLLVVASTEGLFAVDREGLEFRLHPTADGTRRLGDVDLDDARGRRLAEGVEATAILERTRTRAYAALAAEAVGVASRAVELAVAYTAERQQFGKPIGAYQAVAHQVADAFMDTENARSLATWATAAVEGGADEAPVAAAAAFAFAAEAAARTCERAIQVHGGIGFTWEHVLHRLYKRALWITAFLGGPAEARRRVAASLLD
jgi:alkylation response protein AidB-like acyl-CoA dehydrogenase